MHDLAPIIKDLAVMLGVAGFVTLLFQYIRQPVVLGYLVAGFLVGPHLSTYSLLNDIPNIKVIAELGVIFLMFSLGLEFSFHKLVSVGFSASITGLLEVVLMMTIGFVTGKAIGWSFYDSIFLGAALSISSTTIIIKALEELRLKGKRFAELIFGVLIVEDLLAILLLVALSSEVGHHGDIFVSLFMDTVKLILVVSSWFLIGYFLVPFFFRRIIDYASQETLTIISIAFCLLLVCVAAYFNYTPALGAFIMGSILAETPQVHRIEELIRPIRDIFAAVFFVSVGMLIDPKLILDNLPIVLLISLVTIIGKICSASVGALLTGQSLSTSLRVGFGMAQIGEFSFIIVGMGLAMEVTSDVLYPIVVAVSAITTFTTPYLIRLSGGLVSKIETYLPADVKNFLNNYSTWVYRTLADKKESVSYRKIIMRFFVNAIIVAVIFTLINEFLSPYLRQYITRDWLVEVISWITAMLLSSPFIWAKLFAVKTDVEFTDSKSKSSYYLLISIIWAMVIAEVVFLSIAYFYTWVIVGILLAVVLIFFWLFYARIGQFYYWFENNFLANIRQGGDQAKGDQFKQLAPWDNYLVSLTIDEDAMAHDKTLIELEIRQKYGINIVAIQRQHELIIAPRGEQVLHAHDQLVVLGSDNQIDEFREVISSPETIKQPVDLLHNFSLKPILLEQDSPLVGISIRDSKIREKANGLVVGLERQGREILNPDPATTLAGGDLLLIVGEAERLKLMASIK
jgi:CPA2 family monovalent cation:H+ antiporter-2